MTMEWQEWAACSGTDTNIFFPENGDNRAALIICSRCPVVQECDDYAESNKEENGIWGGKTESQRRRDRRLRRLSPVYLEGWDLVG